MIPKLSFFSAEKKPQTLLFLPLTLLSYSEGTNSFQGDRKAKIPTGDIWKGAMSIPPRSLIFSRCVTRGVQHFPWCHLAHFCPFCSRQLCLSKVEIWYELQTYCSLLEASRMGLDLSIFLDITFVGGSLEGFAWRKTFSEGFLTTI